MVPFSTNRPTDTSFPSSPSNSTHTCKLVSPSVMLYSPNSNCTVTSINGGGEGGGGDSYNYSAQIIFMKTILIAGESLYFSDTRDDHYHASLA